MPFSIRCLFRRCLPTHTHSLIHSLSHSHTYTLTHSLTHLHTHSLTYTQHTHAHTHTHTPNIIVQGMCVHVAIHKMLQRLKYKQLHTRTLRSEERRVGQ